MRKYGAGRRANGRLDMPAPPNGLASALRIHITLGRGSSQFVGGRRQAADVIRIN